MSAQRVDSQCFVGASTTGQPGALLRGGDFGGGSFFGPLSVIGLEGPASAFGSYGFRCAR